MSNCSKTFIYLIILAFIIASIYALTGYLKPKNEEISLSTLSEQVKNQEVKKILINGNNLEIELKNGKKELSAKEESVSLSEYGIKPSDVEISVKNGESATLWVGLISGILPILLIAGFIWFLFRSAQSGNNRALSFGKVQDRFFNGKKKKKTTFKDVAGLQEPKYELEEIVEFLKNPSKFRRLGAEIPKGVLLLGPPGVGKTLLAKAVAGEANVPFFSISASEFVEMFVGVGASVSADTRVLIRNSKEKTKLLSIAKFVDRYFIDNREGYCPTPGTSTLGFERRKSGFRGENGKKMFFGSSAWKNIKGVYRHKVDQIYEIEYLGGKIRTTGDHSIFVREKNMIRAKRVDELKCGEILVNLPFKVRGAFLPDVGTTHKVMAHHFTKTEERYLEIWREDKELINKYEYSIANIGVLSQAKIAQKVGVSQATVGNWQNKIHKPQRISVEVFKSLKNLPQKAKITSELLRLFGYYLAEGRAAKYALEFTFGIHERNLQNDCAQLIKNIFNLDPRINDYQEYSTTRIAASSVDLTRFFRGLFGIGSKKKHLPNFVWDLNYEEFLSLLEGWSKGDGYITKEGKLSVTSASRQLILEMDWLCAMHGLKAGIRRDKQKAGRIINKKPLPEGVYYNLIIGATTNPFFKSNSPQKQFKKPYIKKIKKMRYKGFVYDLCGCDNEAFFGGEKPILLHNSRTRDLFDKAKKNSPSIVFIDELDAVGRQRGAGLGGSHDEREQTLNQILVEMDGFDTDTNVIILAATNRPDVLDPALLRPGRFDRRVILDLPDVKEREAILKIHSRNKPLSEDVNFENIAKSTPGFSGADLENLMNEAAILAAQKNKNQIYQDDIERSIEKVMLGPERRSHLLSKKEKEITAYHEAGHGVVAHILPQADPVHKISLVSRGMALGYTLKLPIEDRKIHSKSQFLDELASLLGGRAAEELIFDEITTGAQNDLREATKLARQMVKQFGMTKSLGPVIYGENEELVFLGRELGEHKNYSEETASKIDAAVMRIIIKAQERAKKVLIKHKDELKKVAAKLLKDETINQKDFRKIF